MTGAELFVKYLLGKNTEKIFGIPGNQLNEILFELHRKKNKIDFILARHEGGASIMADSYARILKKPGICMVIPGPGVSNAYTGMLEAYTACSPVLLISIHQETTKECSDFSKLFHGFDHIEALKPVTKYQKRVTEANQMQETLNKAFEVLESPRPRPVFLEFCQRALTDEVEAVGNLFENVGEKPTIKLNGQIDACVEHIRNARKPLIVSGQGVYWNDISEPIEQLSKLVSAPVTSTIMGKGSYSEYHENYIGSCANPETQELVSQADLVIAVGTRFTQLDTNDWNMRPGTSLIHIESDEQEINQHYRADVGISGNIKQVVTELIEKVEPKNNSTAWGEKAIETKNRIKSKYKPVLLSSIRKAIGDNDILVSDVHLDGYPVDDYFPVNQSWNLLFSGISLTLGYGIPAAIGAKIAKPLSNVICFCGDGGFLMSSPDFATARKYNLNIVFIIVNDGAFGTVKYKHNKAIGDSVGTELYNPDFELFAESYNSEYFYCDNLEDFEKILKQTLQITSTSIIEVNKVTLKEHLTINY